MHVINSQSKWAKMCADSHNMINICMGKHKTCSPIESSHDFLLRPIRKTFFMETVTINFAPLSRAPQTDLSVMTTNFQPPQLQQRSRSITPKFNKDSKHYTACFVNPFCSDEQQGDSVMLASHEVKLRDSVKQIPSDQILIPKPRRRATSYCSVCRSCYADYLEHVESTVHKKSAREAVFERDIMELVRRMGKQHQQMSNGVLTRSAKRRLNSISNEEIQFVTKPRKKRVVARESVSHSQKKSQGSASQKLANQQEGIQREGKRQLSTLLKSQGVMLSDL